MPSKVVKTTVDMLAEQEASIMTQTEVNLVEAVASCSGALVVAQPVGALRRVDVERLQAARICLMMVMNRLRRFRDLRPITAKWFDALPERTPAPAFLLDKRVGA